MDAAAYYSDLTRQYEQYGGDAYGWHYGAWEPGVRTHTQALVRANERLLRGISVDASTRILDVGCGSGGFAVWAASTFGARVTGITIVPGHLPIARALAARSGVGHLCDFRLMNMDAMQFEPETFDLVVHQETFCYAADKPACLAAVYRILRPGGWWRAADFSVAHPPRKPWEHELYDTVCEGFHIPSMAPAADVERMLSAAGFGSVVSSDATEEALATAARIIRITWLPRLMDRCGLGWTFRPWDHTRRNREGHVDAAYRYSRGLQQRFCRIVYYSASKFPPGADAVL